MGDEQSKPKTKESPYHVCVNCLISKQNCSKWSNDRFDFYLCSSCETTYKRKKLQDCDSSIITSASQREVSEIKKLQMEIDVLKRQVAGLTQASQSYWANLYDCPLCSSCSKPVPVPYGLRQGQRKTLYNKCSDCFISGIIEKVKKEVTDEIKKDLEQTKAEVNYIMYYKTFKD